MLIQGVLPRDFLGTKPIVRADQPSTDTLGRIPRVGMAEDASPGSFDAPTVGRVAAFFGLAQDDSAVSVVEKSSGRR
jgi:hypothetical protein